MASYEYDLSSEESDEEVVGSLQGYMFEPKHIPSASDSLSTGTDSDPGKADDGPTDSRLGNTTWCDCGRCSHEWLKSAREHVCCHEDRASQALASPSNSDDTVCITNNGEFVLLCENHVVLQNVLVGLNNIRGDHWQVGPPCNRGLRYAAYRQYTWWVHHKLGRRRRRIIPSCVVHKIRRLFPKEEDEEYEGYHSGDSSD